MGHNNTVRHADGTAGIYYNSWIAELAMNLHHKGRRLLCAIDAQLCLQGSVRARSPAYQPLAHLSLGIDIPKSWQEYL